jgi:hypothetical protein
MLHISLPGSFDFERDLDQPAYRLGPRRHALPSALHTERRVVADPIQRHLDQPPDRLGAVGDTRQTAAPAVDREFKVFVYCDRDAAAVHAAETTQPLKSAQPFLLT